MTKWTNEQKRAIETSGHNLLVSAAAGSGKTAVLVERILQKLLNREHPVNITELLVVTFTRAAAAEMRTRIQKSVEKALTTFPEWTEGWNAEERTAMRRHLKKQMLLMEQAEISTIDSFCAGILRNHFHVIDLDPATRTAKEDETELLKSNVLEALLEEEYQSEESHIGFLADYFGSAKTGDCLEEEILALYRFSRNAVDPDAALENYLRPYRIETKEELRTADWNVAFLKQLKMRLSEAEEAAKRLLEMTKLPEGPYYLTELIEADLNSIREAGAAEGYAEFREKIDIDFGRLKTKPKRFEGNPDLADRAKDVRNGYKALIKGIKGETVCPEEEILEDLRVARPAAEELVRLTRRFAENLAAEKKKLRIMDFNDQEHYALDILTEDGRPSDVALAMIPEYEEIMIDEYQDSNELQEAILTSFARRDPETGEPVNVFMVGDVKQSIYRFREADPDLFNDKYRRYLSADAPTDAPEKIELSANFRSRPGVTDAVNFFFRKLMHESLGGVEYNEKAALNPMGRFPETDLPVGNGTTMLLVDPDTGTIDKDEAEAHMIAQEILRLVDPVHGIYVKADDDHVRKASFKDIVILSRTLRHGELFQEVFESYGIPTYMKRKTGFYQTFEIQFALQMLTVIDNPLDEVALTGLLRSPLFGLSSAALGRAVANGRKSGIRSYYEALRHEAAYGSSETAEKLRAFLGLIERFRALSNEQTLSELIRTIYRESGLTLFVGALPGGEQRLGNLNELVGKAAEYEKTCLKGIFNFIRYVAKSRERGDEGEVGTAGENDDLVRLMTIHGSKGLEFPIVFVSGIAHLFNQMDGRETVLHHAKLGVGLRVVRPDKRMEKRMPYYRRVVKNAIEMDNLGEELRVLYVAMTRAKEKLYLTGFLKNSADALGKRENTFANGPETVPFQDVFSAKGYISWLLAAYRYDSPVTFPPVVTVPDLAIVEAEEEAVHRMTREELAAKLDEPVSPAAEKALREILDFEYHYDDLADVYATMTVSALKQAAALDFIPRGTRFAYVKDDTKAGGAARGTLYHRVMELIDPTADAGEEVLRLRNEGLISEDEAGTIDVDDIRAFLASGLGKRFAAAFRAGKFARERQFIIGRPAEELFPDRVLKSRDELVMIQGVLDLYFEEDDGIVLVDYKTDRIADSRVLADEYRVQLDLYEKAIVMMTGKPVKEKWLYSFFLREGIRV